MAASSESAPSARGKDAGMNGHGRARDAAVFASGAAAAVLVLVAAASVLAPTTTITTGGGGNAAALFRRPVPAPGLATARRTFYDDPELSYAVRGRRLTGWDAKRAEWLRSRGGRDGVGGGAVVMVSGSQPEPCAGAEGDHLLLRFLKNKLDYCRLQGIELLYNRAFMEPSMVGYWAKIPFLRAAMLAHPEAEWLWWVDVDAVFTDMDFSLPLGKYRDRNLVLYGWPDKLFKQRSWLGLNAGVFLIRNCQWSLDFMDEWARMGPAWPETYPRWGKVIKAELSDRESEVACDQSALVYLLLNGWDRLGAKVHVETDYYFQAFWKAVVDRFDGVAARYEAVERADADGGSALRRRHAEREHLAYAAARNAAVRAAIPGPDGGGGGSSSWRRPFVTHFVGCAPCSGARNPAYPRETCDGGMRAALDFADDQVLRAYGFRHAAPGNDSVRPLPFDYPAAPP